MRGRALEELEESDLYQILPNSEYSRVIVTRQTVGAKVYCREGKSPDRRIRSLNYG